VSNNLWDRSTAAKSGAGGPSLTDMSPDSDSISWLANVVESLGESLQRKFGALYPLYLERAMELIETVSGREAGVSPIVTAVNLGVRGDLDRMIGDHDDAFKFLMQGAIRILVTEARVGRIVAGETVAH
jgi:hypothetical protein